MCRHRCKRVIDCCISVMATVSSKVGNKSYGFIGVHTVLISNHVNFKCFLFLNRLNDHLTHFLDDRKHLNYEKTQGECIVFRMPFVVFETDCTEL